VITLVLGGARSGKSDLAQRLLADAGDVTVVVTGTATDDDMAARIAAHRARRPEAWATVEAGADLPQALAAVDGPALVDALGTWVSAFPDLDPPVDELLAVLAGRRAATVLVGEEVGLGVHPETDVGRRFRDVLGDVNRAVAEVADEVLLVVAGRALPLERR
jgi:adenosyl cobinamide kinase/adenosyl cobinamide phosphate guanylyltransferase